MATLHVRNVPDELYGRLRQMADEEHKSLSAEVIGLLERAVSADERRRKTLEALDALHRIAVENGPVPDGTAVSIIREIRDGS